MANTLTNLIHDFNRALDVVSRELVGMIPGVTRDGSVDRAAVGQKVYVPIAPAAAATDITPGVTPPDDGDQVIGNSDIEITKSRRVPFRWNGEQTLGLNNNIGDGQLSIQQNQIAQAIRTLTNEIEVDLGALSATMSRATGAAGTTPFGTAGNFTDASLLAKILKDNGAPPVGNRMVLDTTAGANLIGLQSRVDIAGQDQMLRQGVLFDTAGFAIAESAGVVTTTKGTGTGYTTDTAGYSVGDTAITLITGSGTSVAGDAVTFAGDTNKYIVATGLAAPGVITLAAPGLRVAITTSATAMTIGANATQNMGFAPSAIVLAQRAPALPDGGDLAVDRMMVTDTRSGLSFELSLYEQYRQMQYEISTAWGVANIKPEHTAILLG